MGCYHPVPAWRARRVNPETGRRGLSFSAHSGFVDMPVEVPCGKCVGCVQDRANEWAMRCEHEARLYRENWFVTLTYNDASLTLTESGLPTLVKKDLQDFWKRLRNRYDGVRYFACGEYGETYERPHYHALIFNWCPSDLTKRMRVHDSGTSYRSEELESVWGLGEVDILPFSAGAAQYVANYVRKARVALEDGSGRAEEFQVMSRKPGLGSGWLERFKGDVYPHGYVRTLGGSVRKAPRFYEVKLEKMDPRLSRKLKRERKERAKLLDISGSRKYTLEEVHERRNSFFDSTRE